MLLFFNSFYWTSNAIHTKIQYYTNKQNLLKKKLNDKHQNTIYKIMIQSADQVIISYKVLFWWLPVCILFISNTMGCKKLNKRLFNLALLVPMLIQLFFNSMLS
jgi:ATP-dependent Zn protease